MPESREEPLQKEISTHNMLQTPIKRSISKRGQCDCWKTEKKEFLWETITNVQKCIKQINFIQKTIRHSWLYLIYFNIIDYAYTYNILNFFFS